MPYLDNAATSHPKPGCVGQAMADFLANDAANPGRGGHAMAVRAAAVVWQARVALARLVGTNDPGRLVFTLNCTDALNTAMKGLLRAGDHVVTTSMEHNSVVRVLAALSNRGVRHTRVVCDRQGRVEPLALMGAVEPATKLVVVNHASNVAGTVQPVAEIGRLVRERGLVLLVDAAQTIGEVELDVAAQNIDLLAFPGHKGLMGPPGTGGLYVGERVQLTALREGGTGSASDSEEQPRQLPEGLESGTLNTVGIAGLRAAAEYVMQTGVSRLGQHGRGLAARLVAGLRDIGGVTVYGHSAGCEAVACVSFSAAGWDPVELASVLDHSFGIASRAGLHCAPLAHKTLGTYPTGTVRLSPGWFNTESEIDAVVESVRQVVG
jgi:cysteine desulfurase family protein